MYRYRCDLPGQLCRQHGKRWDICRYPSLNAGISQITIGCHSGLDGNYPVTSRPMMPVSRRMRANNV